MAECVPWLGRRLLHSFAFRPLGLGNFGKSLFRLFGRLPVHFVLKHCIRHDRLIARRALFCPREDCKSKFYETADERTRKKTSPS